MEQFMMSYNISLMLLQKHKLNFSIFLNAITA